MFSDGIMSKVLVGIVVGILVTYILLNIMTGCEDWSQPNCVKPMQFFEMILRLDK